MLRHTHTQFKDISLSEFHARWMRACVFLYMMYQFSDLPEKWGALWKTASTIKYEIVPIQAHQIDLISKRITFFNQLSKQFRQEFKHKKVYMGGINVSCVYINQRRCKFSNFISMYFVVQVLSNSMCKCV